MLIIRFARRGRKGQAFFDLVVAEKSRPVKKKIVQKLGYFNPLTNEGEGELVFDQAIVEKFINNGAQVSQSAARLLVKNGCELAGKFIEQRASKPKKTEAPKEAPAEEPVAEAPKEEADAEKPAPQEAEVKETATEASTEEAEAPKTEEPPAEAKVDEAEVESEKKEA